MRPLPVDSRPPGGARPSFRGPPGTQRRLQCRGVGTFTRCASVTRSPQASGGSPFRASHSCGVPQHQWTRRGGTRPEPDEEHPAGADGRGESEDQRRDRPGGDRRTPVGPVAEDESRAREAFGQPLPTGRGAQHRSRWSGRAKSERGRGCRRRSTRKLDAGRRRCRALGGRRRRRGDGWRTGARPAGKRLPGRRRGRRRRSGRMAARSANRGGGGCGDRRRGRLLRRGGPGGRGRRWRGRIRFRRRGPLRRRGRGRRRAGDALDQPGGLRRHLERDLDEPGGVIGRLADEPHLAQRQRRPADALWEDHRRGGQHEEQPRRRQRHDAGA